METGCRGPPRGEQYTCARTPLAPRLLCYAQCSGQDIVPNVLATGAQMTAAGCRQLAVDLGFPMFAVSQSITFGGASTFECRAGECATPSAERTGVKHAPPGAPLKAPRHSAAQQIEGWMEGRSACGWCVH